jgi:hypothetical protein
MTQQELDHALDELYAADPSEFVARRKRLASDLRAAGSKVAADELKAARRPSTSAWALNQLARHEPALIEQLLERSHALQDAQTRALAGDGEAMRDAIRAHRTALDAATQAALVILGPRATDAFRNEIVGMLRAASTDEDVGRTLRLGRLVRDTDTATGFPDAIGLTVAETARPSPKPKTRRATVDNTTAVDDTAAEREAAEAAEREAQRQRELAREDAQRRAADAEADAARAQDRIDRLEGELGDARRDLKAARARAKKANAVAHRISERYGV